MMQMDKKSLSINTLFELSEFFKYFADSTRIRIIETLLFEEVSVNEIASRLQMGQSAISHQLRLLRTAGLVSPRREGRTVYYSLDDEHIEIIFKTGLAHVLHKNSPNTS
ncbi:MAG: winged helix-turn-helix transcriptional regulator [Fibrobacter sp.]|jgi:DNA-binding transcriptional ArsR family regulator|nr:winged helix-turn-helix transcriptional regulator [Fibrobacter sp.]